MVASFYKTRWARMQHVCIDAGLTDIDCMCRLMKMAMHGGRCHSCRVAE